MASGTQSKHNKVMQKSLEGKIMEFKFWQNVVNFKMHDKYQRKFYKFMFFS